MSVVLAIMAISASTHPTPNNSIPLNQTIIPHRLSFNASRTLRRHGFNAIATVLQIYPEIFLSLPPINHLCNPRHRHHQRLCSSKHVETTHQILLKPTITYSTYYTYHHLLPPTTHQPLPPTTTYSTYSTTSPI
ncbi:hypothetical protein HYC85_014382 [Camellia sinensis]|uniref:Uncharacterized protein n=1 Tax=Camellia sinensis TaxID=4442 RepID=A0A7J7H7B9_CAMSI|nr:hypothetical protein HYC85_014382 [Camellia sinensis]